MRQFLHTLPNLMEQSLLQIRLKSQMQKLKKHMRRLMIHFLQSSAKQKTISKVIMQNSVRTAGLTVNRTEPFLGRKITPLHRVGVYVPGGKAVYPSSVLMNVMPAKVAGVDEIIMVTPPGKNGKVSPNTLVAAKEAGVNKNLQGRRCTGNCSPCIRNREYPEG